MFRHGPPPLARPAVLLVLLATGGCAYLGAPQGEESAAPAPETPARLKPILESKGPADSPLAFQPEPTELAPPPADLPPPQPFESLPMAAAEPEADVSSEPVAWLPESDADPAGMPPTEDLDTAAIAAQVDEAVEPAMPAAMSFSAPESTPPTAEPGPDAAEPGPPRLDGPPPPAPNRPFFLEDAEPPRAFGTKGAPSAPAPTAEPAAPTPPRLFGTPAPEAQPEPPAEAAPEPSATPPEPLPEPVAIASAPPAPAPRNGTMTDGPPPALATRKPAAAAAPRAAAPVSAPAPVADSEPAAAEPVPEARTSSGLTKRVPRSAGATRNIPGAEAERGVAATRRSPEEIRNMLSQHSAGRQRASVQPPAPAGSPEENESND